MQSSPQPNIDTFFRWGSRLRRKRKNMINETRAKRIRTPAEGVRTMNKDDVRKTLEKQMTLLSERSDEAKSITELCLLSFSILRTAEAIVNLNPLDL